MDTSNFFASSRLNGTESSALAAKIPQEPVRTRSWGSQHDFQVERLLTQGSYGKVFLASHVRTGREFVVKAVQKETDRSPGELSPSAELQLHSYVSKRMPNRGHVAKYIAAYEDDVHLYTVMEACCGPTIEALLLAACGPIAEAAAGYLLKEAAATVHQLHTIGVLHRDIKPDNFMFVQPDGHSPLVVIDFGLSLYVGAKSQHSSQWTVGSLLYVAPEAVNGGRYSSATDVWSLGVLLYRMLIGHEPFTTIDEIADAAVDVPFAAEVRGRVTAEAEDLLRGMLQRDPARRATMHAVLGHPFVMRAADNCADLMARWQAVQNAVASSVSNNAVSAYGNNSTYGANSVASDGRERLYPELRSITRPFAPRVHSNSDHGPLHAQSMVRQLSEYAHRWASTNDLRSLASTRSPDCSVHTRASTCAGHSYHGQPFATHDPLSDECFAHADASGRVHSVTRASVMREPSQLSADGSIGHQGLPRHSGTPSTLASLELCQQGGSGLPDSPFFTAGSSSDRGPRSIAGASDERDATPVSESGARKLGSKLGKAAGGSAPQLAKQRAECAQAEYALPLPVARKRPTLFVMPPPSSGGGTPPTSSHHLSAPPSPLPMRTTGTPPVTPPSGDSPPFSSSPPMKMPFLANSQRTSTSTDATTLSSHSYGASMNGLVNDSSRARTCPSATPLWPMSQNLCDQITHFTPSTSGALNARAPSAPAQESLRALPDGDAGKSAANNTVSAEQSFRILQSYLNDRGFTA